MLDVSLAGLFSWENIWAPLSVIVILFMIGGMLPGQLFARIPVTQVFRRYTEGKKAGNVRSCLCSLPVPLLFSACWGWCLCRAITSPIKNVDSITTGWRFGRIL